MTEFGAAATLEVDVDRRALADAKSEIEDEIGDVSVGVSGGGGVRADGGSNSAIATLSSEAEDQTDLLEDILDELEKGVGGGGGGGGFLGGGGGLGDAAVTGGSAGLLSRIGSGGIGGALAKAGPPALGGLLGLGGVRGLQKAGVTGKVRGAGERARDLPGGEIAGDAAQFTPGLSLGTGALDLAQGDLSFSNTRELFGNRKRVAGNVGDALGGNGPPTGPMSPTGKVSTSPERSGLSPGGGEPVDSSIINTDAIGRGMATSFQDQLRQQGLTTEPTGGGGSGGGGGGGGSGGDGTSVQVNNDVTVEAAEAQTQEIERKIDEAVDRARDEAKDLIRDNFDFFGQL